MGWPKKTVALASTTARRLFESTRYVEQQRRSEAPALATAVDFGGLTMLIVTTALNDMSGNAPGLNGRGKIQKFNGTTYSDASSAVYPIVNDTTFTVAVGSYVLCGPGPGGMFHAVVVDKCANLS